MPCLLILPLFMGIIYPFLDDVCCLDCLKENTKMNPSTGREMCIFNTSKGFEGLPWPGLSSKLKTPCAFLESSGRPCLEVGAGAVLVR